MNFFIIICSIIAIPSLLLSKIYDCFLFFNELDILEIRLEELYPVIDKFVLVESTETFTGKDKPLYFAENRHRFKKFEDKIIHVIVEDRLQTDNPWDREHFQRNQIMRGLAECKQDDCIIISDVDEIIKASRLHSFVSGVLNHSHKRVGAAQRLFFYYLNRYAHGREGWIGPSATTYGFLRTVTPEWIRGHRGDNPVIPDMGWHFTWMGGPKRVTAKTFAQSHDEYLTKENFTNEEKARYLHLDLPILPINYANFPKFVVENQEYLRSIGLLE